MPPIIITDFEQGSEAWFQACCGNPGASSVDKIVTTEGKRSKQRDDYMMQLAGERITGKREDTFISQAMQNGIEREASARALFEIVHGVDVQQVGVVYKDASRFCHCSPDGLVGDNAGLELKSPMMKTHVKYLLAGKLPTDYFCQVQMSMYVTEREKWWFMSYYEGLPPMIIEVKRDEVFIGRLDEELKLFCSELITMVKTIGG